MHLEATANLKSIHLGFLKFPFNEAFINACYVLIQLTVGTLWMASGTATMTAAWIWCQRMKCVPREHTSFSTRNATLFLCGRPVALFEVCFPTMLISSENDKFRSFLSCSRSALYITTNLKEI